MSKDLSFVILCWNSQNDIRECIDSFVSVCVDEKISYEIIVIDNGSTDSSPDILKKYSEDNPNISYESLPENSGTTYSRNLALKKASGQYICILDSDTVFLKGKIRDIFRYFESNPDVGIAAPKLELLDKKIQNSVKQFPTFLEKIFKISPILGFGSYYKNDFYKDFPFTEIKTVDTAISACWFFPKTIIDTVGLLDEKIFYAPEDLDYCVRVWDSGKKIVYFPHLVIKHKTNQISHNRPFSKVSISHFFGLIYYFRKHKNWFIRKKVNDV